MISAKLLKRLRNGLLGAIGLAVLTALVCAGLSTQDGDGAAIAVLAGLSGFVGLVIGVLGVNVD